MKKKEEITDGLTVPRREGDLDWIARWRSGALIDGGAVDHRGIVDPCSAEGSGQEVSVCRRRGKGRGRRHRVGGAGGGERRQNWRTNEKKMGTKIMPLAADYPTCHVIASPTHKRCQESPSTETWGSTKTWGINISDLMVNTH